jgi:hypothetical protein
MTTYKDLTRGPAWEYRVMRAAFLSGWYVRRGVNLRERVRNSPQTLAEIDILGLGFDPALVPRTLVGECKDRKGGTKEADRIVWVLGLSRLLRIDHVLFAKRSLSDATVQFAQPAGFMLWDEAAVRSIEQRFNLDPDSGFFGSANIELQEDVLRPSRKASAMGNRPFRTAWEYLSGAFWYHPTPPRTKSLAGYFDALQAARSLGIQARSGFVAEGLIALLVSAYITAGQLVRHSPARGDKQQETLFASGAADAHTLREIAARADDYYQDALHRAVHSHNAAGATEIQVPRLANTIAEAPGWMLPYLAFARRLGERPLLAGDTLRYADIVLFEHLLAGNPMPELLGQAVPSDRDTLQTTIQLGGLFLQRVWGVDDPLLHKLVAMPKAKAIRKRPLNSMHDVKTEASLFDTAPTIDQA